MVIPELERWVATLEDDRLNRELCWGWQAWIRLGDTVVCDEARGVDGVKKPLRDHSLQRLYCAGRPLTALALATLVDDGELGFDTPLHDALAGSDVLSGPHGEVLGSRTLAQVLSNRSGLHRVGAAPFSVTPPRDRTRLLRAIEPVGDPHGAATYDEYAGWFLLALVVEHVTGTPWHEHARTAVLEPLDVSDEIFAGFDDAEWTANSDRVAVNVDLMERTPVPLLADATPMMGRQRDPAIGVYATTRGLGRCYAELARARSGEHACVSAATLEAMTGTHSPREWDDVLERECAYGLGFMVGLRDHGFGTHVGPAAFGHAGFRDYGAFYDPDHDLVVAISFVGILDPRRSASFERERRVNELYDALGLATPHADATTS